MRDKRRVEERRGSVLALILAGGQGGRLGPLTDERAKPSLPFAGVYRLIDFPLSNCMHSGLTDVWVLVQYAPHSLDDHMAGGRPWDYDRSYGGLRLLHPHQGTDDGGWYRGNADAIYRNSREIARFDPDAVLVLSADHVYKLDYREVLAAHFDRDADLTVVTKQLPREEAGRYGVVEVDEACLVTGFEYKPDEPKTDVVTAEIFVYRTARLLELLEELAQDVGEGEDSGLEDFGDQLLPRLVREGRVFGYALEGYWRDVGTLESYWQAHMELLEPEPSLDLAERSWAIHTFGPQHPPARLAATADVGESLVSPGCVVAGRVRGSVLAPGVVVEEGAEVLESVLLADVRVRAGVRVARAIVDEGVTVSESVSGSEEEVAVVAGPKR
ncbi:MAG: glucose-1-phosphate adenylyltransferase [Actinobacteria bacterium]|nr:glucose-1-phosphate adenylyltransferase [Actinomycetota bacterium]